MKAQQRFVLKQKTRYLGKKFFHLSSCKSTQVFLKERLFNGDAIGTAVISKQQTHGRGQHGKQWVDTGLSQLFCSFSMGIDLPVQQLPIVNIATALSVIDVLQNIFSVQGLSVKWPNDIYMGSRKLGGVISETFGKNKITALIIGLGINFGGRRVDLPESIQENSTTLYEHGYDIDQKQFLNHFMVYLESKLESPREELIDWIQGSFSALHHHKNQEIEIDQGDRMVKGVAQAIDKNGRLLLTTANNDKIIISSGHIRMKR